MVKDEWVRAAMMDDSVVVELLVRLKKTQVAKSALPALRWGIRQPRSKSVRCDGVSQRTKGDSANGMRASPTTPLSWSGGGCAASPSATADEETSGHHTSSVRSKGIAASETTSNTAKRSRRKKTFAELKEEEGTLLKERIHLKQEVENLRATFKMQNARNENLKRIKLDLGLYPGEDSRETFSEPEKTISTRAHCTPASSLEHTFSTLPSHSTDSDLPQSCETHEARPACNRQCLLPDLNMMPSEDDSCSETLFGIS